jgi:hypothetical protein
MDKSHLIYYYNGMSRQVNSKKDQKNKATRGHSVLEIVEGGELLATLANKNYPGQFLKIYKFNDYAWVVVVGEKPPRFITHYKSRNFKKIYKEAFI